MTLPLSSPFTSLTKVTKLQLDQLVTAINALPFGFLTDASSSAAPVLATVGTYVADAAATITLTTQRRIRISGTGSLMTASSAPAHYGFRVGYTAGAVVGTQTVVGLTYDVSNNATGNNGSNSAAAIGTVLLPAGTYTIFVAAARTNGGSATDTLSRSYVIIEDTGAV